MQNILALAVVAASLGAAAMAETLPNDVTWAEDGSVAQSLTGVAGNPDEGKVIMTTNALGNCVACHVVAAMPDVPFQGNIAPQLDGAADRWTEAQLRGIVIDAKRTFPESFMPGMYKTGPFIRPGIAFTAKPPEKPEDIKPILSAQQVEDVVAYLMTLKE
ncbi:MULTISPECIES: sulfur oxidation c-type cytochrome SoxX [unclassified Paracoccus (in: a-proteobacteria)]|uniref:sulfur oxidation c-type cytochrome SoxX n=1 Tax=unclassified Paracoccus (in: a-proteobacteria) TaxID=2688777 RepID=UPI0012B3FF43|nr:MULTISPECIES: sulfur oxidation c-type cytochrome SoxX [unclassified Paracoccus (in: a-proteobacteria)]UXU76336.1 sulfur oxidation c-type cytochrome SoxX [Paracoccus sp. SMMA_5]UXU82326.1 sulfur oxidation c-type cytochrome SoxX [Paracoccus sp. SMMA_5_TC]